MSQLQVTGEAKIRDIQGPVVANSGVITALNGAANQYVRGDGTLASFPTSGGGGSSVSYYLNGSVNQGTFGGSTYYQMSKNAIVGTGTNFSASANGLIAQFITDVNDPDVVSIPSGNWNVEFFMNVSASSGALASFYVEFYKYNGSTFTLLATNVATPEQLTNTTTVDAYYTSVAMPLSTMAVTDRLAIRIFVNVAGKTVTLYTEDNRLCQVVTTFSKGLASLNNLTDQSQYLTTGTSGTNFNIVSSGDTHTFNLPVASATNTGKLSNTDWSTFNNKQAALSFTAPLVNTSNTISIPAATSLVDGYLDNLDWVNFNTAYNDSIISAAVTGTTTKTLTLNQQDGGTITASWTDINTDAVTSVFGRTGAVVAASGDYTTTQVTEGTNLYYTDARSRGALSFTAGSGAYNSTTGVITIPTNNNQITNGAGYITSSALTSYVPYTGATANVNLGNNDFTALGISGIAIEAKLNGTGSSPLILRTGTSGYSYGNDSISLISSPTSANTLTIVSDVSSVTKIAQIGLGSLTATRTFTLPDASGTLALTSQLTGGTVTSVGLSSATSGVTIGSSPITTSGTITLTIATASGSQNGLLSSTDWTTFNGKQAALTNPITGTGTRTINYLPIFSGSDTTIANSAITDNGTTVTLISRALSGTSATFSSTTTATAFIPSGSTIPTNGMYLSAANTLNFATNSLNRFTIASDGIATFGTDLYVNRNIYVNNAEGGVYSDFYGRNSTSTSTPLAFLYGSAGTVTWNNGGTKMTLTSAGALQLVSSISATSATLNGNVIINSTATALSPLQVVATGTIVRLGEQSGTTGKQFLIGIDATSGRTELQSLWQGTSFTSLALQPSGGNVLIGTTGDNGAKLQVSGAATFSSSVGIGGVSPTRILHLSASGSNCAIRIDNSVSGRPVILSYDDSQNLTLLNSSDSGYFAYVNGTGSGTERMRITSGGEILVSGTYNPYAFANRGNITMNGTNSNIIAFTNGSAVRGHIFHNQTDMEILNKANGTMTFWTNDTERMRITSGGSVLLSKDQVFGINTSDGSDNGYLALCGASGDGDNRGGHIYLSGNERGADAGTVVLSAGNVSSGAVIVRTGAGAERARITSGGNLLIGKSTTGVDTNGFRFDSNGVLFTSVPTGESTYYLRDTTNAVYRFYVTSGGTINATNTTISAISDVRLKENIVDLEIGLDAIMALRPRQFDWKKESGNDGKNVRGFIAQEFEEVFPDLIDESINKTPEGEPYKQIRQDLIPILVKAIQEQQAQIEELSNKIVALQSK